MAFMQVTPSGSVKNRRQKKDKDGKKVKPRRKSKGIVYILKMELGPKEMKEKTIVYKIGITARRTRALESRVSEIAASHFMSYRYFPMIYPRKFSKTEYFYEIENWFHRIYQKARYYPDKKFDGHTELFIIPDEDELIRQYEMVMKNPLKYITPLMTTLTLNCDKDKEHSEPEVDNDSSIESTVSGVDSMIDMDYSEICM